MKSKKSSLRSIPEIDGEYLLKILPKITGSIGEVDEALIGRDKSVTFLREIFYRHPKGTERFRLAVRTRLKQQGIEFEELGSGEVWNPSSDADALKGRSHWYFRAVIDPTTVRLT